MATPESAPASLYGIDLGDTLTGRRILVGDANAFNRKTLVRFLTWSGVGELLQIEDGAAVLDAVAQFQPDLLVLDPELPSLDGLAVCRQLREHPDNKDLPILMQVSAQSDHLRTLSFQAGASDTISKPVNPGECIARVRHHLERRSLLEELRRFRARVERDLRVARAMQTALVPDEAEMTRIADHCGLTIQAHFQSSDEIGGDLWSLFELDDQRVAVLVADFTGHGIAAAINAFRLHTMLTRMPTGELEDPAGLFNRLNVWLHQVLSLGQYATAFYGIIDTRRDLLRYVSACAPTPLAERNGVLEAIDASGVYLGPFEDETFEEQRVAFPPGSALFLYSDALVESEDAGGAMLGEDGLLRLVQEARSTGHERPLPFVLDRFHTVYGAGCHDDLTAVWLCRH